MGETAENEAAVRRFYSELWNEWRFELADELFAADLRFRGSLGTSVSGRAELLHYRESVRATAPGCRRPPRSIARA
jgi:hypothetical protein